MLAVLGQVVIGRFQPYPLLPLWGFNARWCKLQLCADRGYEYSRATASFLRE